MEFKKQGNNIRITNLKITPDIRNFIACQISFKLVFVDNNIEIDSLYISERKIENKKSVILIGDVLDNKFITRNTLLNKITKLCKQGIPEIIIDKNTFDRKNSLIELLQDSKQMRLPLLTEGIVDYENEMLSIIVPNHSGGNKNTEEIYFWPYGNPRTLYGFKANSVEIYPEALSVHTIDNFLFGK